MLATARTRPMKFESRWYLAERAAHARTLAKPMRPTTNRDNASEKAMEYARWLLARDRIDLDAIAEVARTAWNAMYPPTKHRRGARAWEELHSDAIPADMAYSARVAWDHCEAGQRPRHVHFEFAQAARDGWRRAPARHFTTFLSVELPHWDAEIADTAPTGEA